MDKQLVHVKRLYLAGCEFAERGDGFSAGLAVSLFQDSAESFIRCLLRHLDGTTNDFPKFAELIGAVKGARGNTSRLELPCKQKLRNLNAARVSFKHDGLVPDSAEAAKFMSYTLEFLTTSSSMFFDGLDFDQISLIDLIPYADVHDELKKAEQSAITEDWQRAAVCCSCARSLILKRMTNYVPIQTEFYSQEFRYQYVSGEFFAAAMLGMPVKKYADICADLPLVDWSESGQPHARILSIAPIDRALVEPALLLVTEMALKLQEFLGDT